jgi:large subunit ribosomal protein L17
MIHGRIVTTIAKAKELRPFVEKLVTIAKADTVSSRRLVASRMMNDTDTVAHLHSDIAPKFKERAGGYTRITKLGVTQNPLTDSALIEFVQ